ncbi:hypothetical protein OH77DRAFT_1468065 [Trametes cingulata]|nr:hypothetical protein OH77DRAFT_1468065 [Trametes cingulata]
MTFAQFYYDPALEFEKLLDDDDGPDSQQAAPAGAAAAVPAKIQGTGAMYDALSPPSVKRTRTTSANPDSEQPSQERASRWFGSGFLRRRASTGSIHGGSHPGVPK